MSRHVPAVKMKGYIASSLRKFINENPTLTYEDFLKYFKKATWIKTCTQEMFNYIKTDPPLIKPNQHYKPKDKFLDHTITDPSLVKLSGSIASSVHSFLKRDPKGTLHGFKRYASHTPWIDNITPEIFSSMMETSRCKNFSSGELALLMTGLRIFSRLNFSLRSLLVANN